MNWKSFEPKENWIKVSCHYCGKEFFVMPSYVKDIMYCNRNHQSLDPYRGKKISESSKKCKLNSGRFKKDHTPWNKNVPMTKELKKILSKVQFKKGRTPWNKDIKMDKPPWNKGTKGVMKSWNKDRTYKEIFGEKKANEIRQKMSDNHKGKKSNKKGKTYEEMYGEKKGRQLKILKRISALNYMSTHKGPFMNTSIELLFKDILDNLNISYQQQKRISNITVVDFFIEPNICIFCDGRYYHASPKKYKANDLIRGKKACKIWEKDTMVNKILLENGYIVYRFWEHEIKKSPEDCISRIKELSLIEKSR